MVYNAIKTFQIEEESVEATYYRIQVKFRGVLMEEFIRPTMKEAIRAFEDAGYQRSK